MCVCYIFSGKYHRRYITLHHNFLGYGICEKFCHPKRLLTKMYGMTLSCYKYFSECSCYNKDSSETGGEKSCVSKLCSCKCTPSFSDFLLLALNGCIVKPISFCLSILKVVIPTCVLCALDYTDLTKDLGFILVLEYISDAIIVSNYLLKSNIRYVPMSFKQLWKLITPFEYLFAPPTISGNF